MSNDLAVVMPSVVVFVGAAASGKTTLRHRLLDAGLDPALVVNLDTLRADSRLASGQLAMPLMRYSAAAARAAARRERALLDSGAGYLADSTHLRRAERRRHIHQAHDAGLPAIGVLMPDLPAETLTARNASRLPDHRVPDDVLHRHAHRRSLLDAAGLRVEGFDAVQEVTEPARTRVMVAGGARTTPVTGEPQRLGAPSGPVARLHDAPGPLAGAVLLDANDTRTLGPALAEELRYRGVTCLRLGPPRASRDVLAAAEWLVAHRIRRVVLLSASANAAAEAANAAADTANAVVAVATPDTVGAARLGGGDPDMTSIANSLQQAFLGWTLRQLAAGSER